MTLTERRGHWRAGHKDAELLARQREFDPSAGQHQCFTLSVHAAEWLSEQLAERTVADIGGFDEAAAWYDWLKRQATQDEEADAQQRHASQGGAYHQITADIGGIEYRIEVCTCTGDVTGRCDNLGCDRDTDYDSEPDGGTYPGYTKWYGQCGRCFGGRHADGGYSSEGTPAPLHRHDDADGPAYLRKLIEGDEWTGWRCTGEDQDTACGEVWRFADADEWASQYRLTRIWGDKVTGTQGYTRTETEANDEAQRLNQMSADRNWGWTVGVEKIEKENEQ